MDLGKKYDWSNKKVLVTGGASFIGSHLVDKLIAKGVNVRVVDNLSSGKLDNIDDHIKNNRVEFVEGDLRDTRIAKEALKDIEVVFHLAADHGGRGYVDLNQAGPASNLALDGIVFYEAVNAGVKQIVYASSGCVYPNYLQSDVTKEIYLTEDMVKPPHDADNMYGWAKLMAELTLKAYAKKFNIGTASCRYFTVYGPRGVENHAVIAMVARAFIKQDPYEVWGDGSQIRNWTFVDDIVDGTILAAEKIKDGRAINMGTMERITVRDAVQMAIDYANYSPNIKFLNDMPTGPLNRVADNSLAKEILGWEPKVKFKDGFKITADWYFKNKKTDWVKKNIKNLLLNR